MKKREANFELLRVIAMFMVVILHYLSHADVLIKLGTPIGYVNLFATLLESFCIVAVNVWVLISGYFLSTSGFHLKRIIQLICEVLFYTVTVSIVMQIAGTYSMGRSDGFYKIAQYCFPIASEHYWFATSYVFMYILSPVLNSGVRKLSRWQLKVVIMGLLLWFCFIKSIIPVNFVTDDMGYGLNWFIVLYLIAAYIRKYDVRIMSNGKQSSLLYFVSVVLIFVIELAVYKYNSITGGFNYYFDVPFHYNYILCLTGALGIFSSFRYLKIRNRVISNISCFLAPMTFGVYLLHEHIEIRDRWLVWMQNFFGPIPGTVFSFAGHLLISVIVVFFAGVFVDFIRIQMFNFVSRMLENTKLMAWINYKAENLKSAGLEENR
ncbi:MAG: acyltransferase [Butyrivibrio sp.]|nr:acyltransferase [Butyrivibrio sp.]